MLHDSHLLSDWASLFTTNHSGWLTTVRTITVGGGGFILAGIEEFNIRDTKSNIAITSNMASTAKHA